MYITNNHLVWYECAAGANGPKFLWAKTYALTDTKELVNLTLVAGSIAASGGCVKPPTPSKPGLEIEFCKGSDTESEVVTVHRGMLCVRVEKYIELDAEEIKKKLEVGVKDSKGTAFPIWPFIIRSHAIPAGSYSSDFVVIDLNKADGKSLTYVFRPNQDAFLPAGDCTKAGEKDSRQNVIVYADPSEKASIAMDNTSQVSVDTGGTIPTKPTDLNAAETAFLKETCAFHKVAMAAKNKAKVADPQPSCYK